MASFLLKEYEIMLEIKLCHFVLKGSVFKSWKKRHFKAVGGKLFYYEVHKYSDLLRSCIEWFSSECRKTSTKVITSTNHSRRQTAQ